MDTKAQPLCQGELLYWPGFLSKADSRALFEELRQQSPWQQEQIQLFGQQHLQPRLSAWFGVCGLSAASRYSKAIPAPEFSPLLRSAKLRIEALFELSFNAALINLYRDGRDGVGPHRDAEKILGPNPCIASLSLGATRRFSLRRMTTEDESEECGSPIPKTLTLDLEDGDLVIMHGELQKHYKHALLKTKRVVGERINVSLRYLHTAELG